MSRSLEETNGKTCSGSAVGGCRAITDRPLRFLGGHAGPMRMARGRSLLLVCTTVLVVAAVYRRMAIDMESTGGGGGGEEEEAATGNSSAAEVVLQRARSATHKTTVW